MSSNTENWSADDHRYMARAVELAKCGLYTTEPNPRVGCVLVRDGAVIGEGFHRIAGEGHAEVNALQAVADAGDTAAGATAYVTLEPCSHFGKTPPCAEALVKAGVAQVIIGMVDPNPQVSGRGIKRLEDAGIRVRSGLLNAEAESLNPGFNNRMRVQRPFVRLKLAASLDGRTAMASGESQWITGPQARQDVQRLRARSSAVVTGIGSILLDDSSLTVRAEQLGLPDAELICQRQPLRVVLDSQGRMPENAKILRQPGKTLVVSQVECPAFFSQLASSQDTSAELEWLQLAGTEAGIDLPALLEALAQRQCNEVLVETGATLAGSFIRQGLVDEVVLYQAMTLLGSEARSLVELPLQKMQQQQRLTLTDSRVLGNDIRLTLVPVNHTDAAD